MPDPPQRKQHHHHEFLLEKGNKKNGKLLPCRQALRFGQASLMLKSERSDVFIYSKKGERGWVVGMVW